MTTITRGPRAADRFAIISNDALGDARLSFRARGLLGFLLSRPDGWTTNAETLATQGTEGRDAIRAALRELEDAGYLTRTKVRGDGGRWVHTALVSDTPGQTSSGFPVAGEPSPVDQALSSKTETKTETNSAPTERPDASPPVAAAAGVAKLVYDATQGAVQFMAARNVADRILRARWPKPVEAANAVQPLADAMAALYGAGKPITTTTVCQVLDGALRLNGTSSALAQRDRQAFTEDWESGAAEASWRALDGAR